MSNKQTNTVGAQKLLAMPCLDDFFRTEPKSRASSTGDQLHKQFTFCTTHRESEARGVLMPALLFNFSANVVKP